MRIRVRPMVRGCTVHDPFRTIRVARCRLPGGPIIGRALSVPSPDVVDAPTVRFSAVSGVRYPGLDGLRGVAVALVVSFHLWPDVVRGGWLGVSLFFTLSGYLIIGLIDNEVSSTGRLRLGRFMARRVRRLMPAALVTISATVALTALLSEQALQDVGVDALMAVLNVFNWHAATDPGGYAAIFEVAKTPLEHFWSLAIEEQFYLLVPAAVAWIRRPAPVVVALTALGLGGLILWWGSPDAYLATPVRALEIAAGAGLALLVARSEKVRRLAGWDPDLSRRTRLAALVIIMLTLVVSELAVAGLRPADDLVFRGFPQFMGLCWVVLLAASLPGGPLERPLSAGFLRWLGTRSYAIYLMHWPLAELTDLSPGNVILITLGLAELSYRLIEMPVRRQTGYRSVWILAAVAVAVALGAGAVIVGSEPVRAGERVEGITEMPAWFAEPLPAETLPPPWEPECPVVTPDGSCAPDPPTAGPVEIMHPPVVTVLGDSTAVHMANGLRRWADTSRSMAVVERAMPACSPLSTYNRPWMVVRTGDDANPRHVVERDEPCRVNEIEPETDLILVVDHAIVLMDHRRTDGSWGSVLDEDLRTDLADSYRELAATARAMGARLILTTVPRYLPLPDDPLPPPPAADENRSVAYNNLVFELATELGTDFGDDTIDVLDMAAILDPSGYDGPYGRSDGSHIIDPDRSVAFATDFLGPALLNLSR